MGELDYRSCKCDPSDIVVDLEHLAGVKIVRDFTNNSKYA